MTVIEKMKKASKERYAGLVAETKRDAEIHDKTFGISQAKAWDVAYTHNNNAGER